MTCVPKRALLLSSGLGTRLRPLTDKTPKCLVPINGTPLLGYWFDLLFQAGIERVLVNTHYLADQVTAYCHDSPWHSRIDLVNEPELIGTAGTVRANAKYLREAENGPFFLAHADNLSVFDPVAFFAAHADRPEGCAGTMMTFMTDDPQSCGVVQLDDRKVIREVHEKVQNPPGNLANAAVFLVETEILDWVCAHPESFDFCKDVVPPLAQKWFTFHNGVFHRDIGTPEALAKAEADFCRIIK